MNRLEEIRKIVDGILLDQSDVSLRNEGFSHLYGVSGTGNLLALKRGLDAELCAISGMLHDIARYKSGCSVEHARLGSIEARKILAECKCFNEKEIELICSSIANHSNKRNIDNPYEELLKDADVLQHYLYNTNLKIAEKEIDRLNSILAELGIQLRIES